MKSEGGAGVEHTTEFLSDPYAGRKSIDTVNYNLQCCMREKCVESSKKDCGAYFFFNKCFYVLSFRVGNMTVANSVYLRYNIE